MYQRRVLGMAAAVLSLIVVGCATIASGTTQSISVSSNVEGAEVFLDGVLIGRTPFTGSVKKNKSQLRIELEGYRSETLELSKTLDPVFWGNIIIGGTLGSLTDFASGAAYQYSPAAYQVDLQSAEQTEEDFLAEVAVRKFSMVYIDEIASDVAAGGGDYLSALVSIVDNSDVDEDAVAAALRSAGGNQVAFGQAMVALR